MPPEPATPADDPLAFIARPTPPLRTAVTRLQVQLVPAEFAGLVGQLRSLFDKYTAKLLEFEPGVARGRALHQLMDRELQAAAHIPVTCRRGCCGCCHYEVEVTQDEAAVLRHAVESGVAVDRDRLDRQAARERRSPEWLRLGALENRCVFLADDGACRIYEDRPAICRKHVVTTPAVACTTPGATVDPVTVLLAEILLSAGLSIAGTPFGSLPGMLHRQLLDSA